MRLGKNLITSVIVSMMLAACSESKPIGVYYVGDTPPCPALTQELIDYTITQASDFFGDDDFVSSIYVNKEDVVRTYCNGDSCAKAQGIAMYCADEVTMCNNLIHEYGHMEAWKRYKDFDHEHQRLGWYWDHFQGWPCLPNVALEQNMVLK